jgi:hypothetical protein
VSSTLKAKDNLPFLTSNAQEKEPSSLVVYSVIWTMSAGLTNGILLAADLLKPVEGADVERNAGEAERANRVVRADSLLDRLGDPAQIGD